MNSISPASFDRVHRFFGKPIVPHRDRATALNTVVVDQKMLQLRKSRLQCRMIQFVKRNRKLVHLRLAKQKAEKQLQMVFEQPGYSADLLERVLIDNVTWRTERYQQERERWLAQQAGGRDTPQSATLLRLREERDTAKLLIEELHALSHPKLVARIRQTRNAFQQAKQATEWTALKREAQTVEWLEKVASRQIFRNSLEVRATRWLKRCFSLN